MGAVELRLEQQSRARSLKILINLILFFVSFVLFVVNKAFHDVFINTFTVSYPAWLNGSDAERGNDENKAWQFS
jgi:hypothetical protein